MFCPNCGAIIPDSVNECPRCHYSLIKSSSQSSIINPTSSVQTTDSHDKTAEKGLAPLTSSENKNTKSSINMQKSSASNPQSSATGYTSGSLTTNFNHLNKHKVKTDTEDDISAILKNAQFGPQIGYDDASPIRIDYHPVPKSYWYSFMFLGWGLFIAFYLFSITIFWILAGILLFTIVCLAVQQRDFSRSPSLVSFARAMLILIVIFGAIFAYIYSVVSAVKL